MKSILAVYPGKVFNEEKFNCKELQDQVLATIQTLSDGFYLHSPYSKTLRRHGMNLHIT